MGGCLRGLLGCLAEPCRLNSLQQSSLPSDYRSALCQVLQLPQSHRFAFPLAETKEHLQAAAIRSQQRHWRTALEPRLLGHATRPGSPPEAANKFITNCCGVGTEGDL